MMSNIKSLMEDLKCNKCLINTKCVQQIFLFECGHMICQRCEKMIVRRQFCHVCKKTARMMELPKENMHPIMEMMFWPFDNVVTQTIRVMNFKMAQEATALRDLMQNYKAAKGSAVTYRLEHEALMEEARTLTEKLIAQGKPVPSVNNHLDDQSVSDGSSIRCAASLCGSTPGTARTDDPKDVSGELSRTGRIVKRNNTIATKGSLSPSLMTPSTSFSTPSMNSSWNKCPKPLVNMTSTPVLDLPSALAQVHLSLRKFPKPNPMSQTPNLSNFGSLSEISRIDHPKK